MQLEESTHPPGTSKAILFDTKGLYKAPRNMDGTLRWVPALIPAALTPKLHNKQQESGITGMYLNPRGSKG